MWNIEKIISKGDYQYGLCREHPKATDKGYVLLHRLIMENLLERELKENEVVHHIDENKLNNEPYNLMVMDRRFHSWWHAKHGRTYYILTCPNCGSTFYREGRQIKPNTTPKCSRRCNGQYSRKIQLGLV